MLLFTLPTYSQSGEKWASNGNAVTPGSFLGTTNDNPLLFKVNNNLFLTLNTNGDIVLKNFAAIDSGLVAFDINGKLIPYPIPHNDKYVLLGNGKWGPLPIPNNYWKLDNTTNHLYTLTTGNVGIGTQTPVMKLDVNGDAIVRGYLYVDNGVIIGKRIESKSVDSDTLRVNEIVNTKELFSRQTYSDSLTAVKVETENLNASKSAAIGTTIIIDGSSSSIISAAGKIDFGSNELRTTGPITGGTFNIGRGNFEDLNVTRKIQVGTGTLVLENDPNGLANSIYTDNGTLFLQSSPNHIFNTVINYNGGKVAVGDVTIDGNSEKLTVAGNIMIKGNDGFDYGGEEATLFLGDNNHYIRSIHGGGLKVGTFQAPNAIMLMQSNGFVGIGTNEPEKKLHIKDFTDNSAIVDNPVDPFQFTGSLRLEHELASGQNSIWDIEPVVCSISDAPTKLRIGIPGNPVMTFLSNGNVGIGIDLKTIPNNNPNNYKLAVNGVIGAKDIVIEVSQTPWPDYVFSNNYKLLPIKELETFVKTNQHLPEIASEDCVNENGLSVGDINVKLLKKIEELTLYVIELNKQNEELTRRISLLENNSK